MMSSPFKKILGNTCEMRIIEFLLPLEDLEFNITELAEESGVSRVTAGKVIKKFVKWGILLKRDNSISYYRLNHDNQIVRSIKLFNTAIIETMLGEEETHSINLLISKKKEQCSLYAPNNEDGKEKIHRFGVDSKNEEFSKDIPIEQTIPSPARAIDERRLSKERAKEQRATMRVRTPVQGMEYLIFFGCPPHYN